MFLGSYHGIFEDLKLCLVLHSSKVGEVVVVVMVAPALCREKDFIDGQTRFT